MSKSINARNLSKVKASQFGDIACDYYSNNDGEFFMTRQQIGAALEYDNPQKAIDKIHERHKERLDRFSVTVNLGATDGKRYDTILYSAKGVYEICRWSKQPKADEFYDHVYDILEGLRLGYLKLYAERQTEEWKQLRQASKANRRLETDAIKEFIEYANAQGSKHADKYYIHFTRLANNAIGIEPRSRDTITPFQLSVTIVLENAINKTIYDGMNQGMAYKDVYQLCKNQVDMFQSAACLKTKIAG